MGFLRELFFPKRLGRLNYFVRGLPLNLFTLQVMSSVELTEKFSATDALWVGGAVVATIYGIIFILWPRAKDRGLPAWTLVFGIVPIPLVSMCYAIVLLFGDSDPGIHGDDPISG